MSSYRVYVRNERCRVFKHLKTAQKYAEKRAKELELDLDSYFPKISICIGSGSGFREMKLKSTGWTPFG